MDSDERSFEELWNRHFDDVLAFAVRRVGRDDAFDVAAEAFAVAWRRRADIPSDPLPWLYGVAKNVLMHHHRSVLRRNALLVLLRHQPQWPASDPAERTTVDPVLVAMRRLSEADREAIALTVWEGLDPARAAAAAGCSVNAFAVRLTRARSRLRKHLAEIDGPSAHSSKGTT